MSLGISGGSPCQKGPSPARPTTLSRVPDFNVLDAVLVLLIGAGIFAGYLQGGVRQALGLAGAAAGALVALFVLPEVAAAIPPVNRVVRAATIVGFLLLALALGELVGGLLAAAITRGMVRGPLRTADRAVGAAIGGLTIVLAAWFLAPVLAVGPSPALAAQIRDSAIVTALSDAMPNPGPVLGRLRAFLDTSGLPQVFEVFDAPAGGPVATPEPAEVADIARRARASIVLIEGDACGMRITGTGFVVAPGYVVTNAHVVAGERKATQVSQDTSAGPLKATVVVFDPDLDVALLRVPGLTARTLPLAGAPPDPGAIGAALGHPDGGDLEAIPAAVRDVFQASGYDIYGRDPVTRTVIELAAEVAPGDSGGPFVTADGRAAGVVFARSRTDGGTGYALPAPDVLQVIEPGLSRTAAVGTGGCVP
jgi:S1-C subfamily serine protease